MSEMISFHIFGISVPLSLFPQSGVVKARESSETEKTGFEKGSRAQRRTVPFELLIHVSVVIAGVQCSRLLLEAEKFPPPYQPKWLS